MHILYHEMHSAHCALHINTNMYCIFCNAKDVLYEDRLLMKYQTLSCLRCKRSRLIGFISWVNT